MPLIVPKVTKAQLNDFVTTLPADVHAEPSNVSFQLWLHVIQRFLGADWVRANLLPAPARSPPNFGTLTIEFTDDVTRETKTLRIFDLAEMLMNLQLVDGFDECIARLRAGGRDQIEATFAELQIAKLIYIHDFDFKFASQIGKPKGQSYDFDITIGSWSVCADAKCKLEASDRSATSVKNSLHEARSQLPRDKPGIIFVKVPQNWFYPAMGRLTMDPAIKRAAEEFMRGTGRVVSTKFYLSHVSFVGNPATHVAHHHGYFEMNNPKGRFGRKHWDMFKGYFVPKGWNGMPPKWIRLHPFDPGV